MLFRIFGLFAFFGDYNIVIADPELIKQVTVKDFDYFTNRAPASFQETDKITGKSLLLAQNQDWKDMRNVLNPMYTSAKLKQIYHDLSACIFDFTKFYEEKANKNNGIAILKAHDAMARTTADGIAITALGFDTNSTRNEKSEVFEMANDIDKQFANPFRGIFLQAFPKLFKLLGMQIFSTKVQKWFEKNVLNEMKRRQELNIQKPDAIHQFLTADKGRWSNDDFVAQGVTLFLGGFSTTTALMEGLFYELAMKPQIQLALIEEVDEVLAELNGEQISHDQLSKMKLLEMVVNEGLRRWSPVPFAQRVCGKDYTLNVDGKSYNLKKGTNIFLPYGSILNDSKYFENPEEFDPYRFSDENKRNIQPGTFLAFGLVRNN